MTRTYAATNALANKYAENIGRRGGRLKKNRRPLVFFHHFYFCFLSIILIFVYSQRIAERTAPAPFKIDVGF